MVLKLNGDGSGVFDGDVLKYTVKGNVLTVIMGVESTAYSFSLNGNQLTLAGGDLDGKLIFSRVVGAGSESSAEKRSPAFSYTSRQLVGIWTGEGELIDFKADGTCQYNGSLFPYSISDGHLVIETTAGKAVFQYAIKGASLTLITNGQQSVYFRPPGSTLSRPAKSEGKIALELVGQWCYLKMTSSAQSSRCLTLNEDGTYSYFSGSSRSVSTNELSGGTSSQDTDTGTWYLSGDRLYYHSAATGNGSYRLEKRNHPKNVNDPMIVLDDEPFVSATQRPPWR